jgi:hypothetical protein
MPILPTSVFESISSSRSSQPRTILGFLFAMSGLVAGVGVLVAVELIGSRSSWLIGPVLLVVGVVLIGVIRAVLKQAQSNPAGLMLGQVTGDEYRQIRGLTLGDSSGGERRVVGRVADPLVVEGTASDDSGQGHQALDPGEADGRDLPPESEEES